MNTTFCTFDLETMSNPTLTNSKFTPLFSPCYEGNDNNGTMASSSAAPILLQHQTFTLDPTRYLVLLSFCLLTLSSAWQWITWSPLNSTNLLSNYWNLNEDHGQAYIDELSAVYMYVFVPGSFVALWLLVNHFGLRKGLLTGGLLNAIGSIIRYQYHSSYKMVFIGTFFCALGQCFTLATPPFIAGVWFGSKERGIATALGVLANQLGTALGLGASIYIDFEVHVLPNGNQEGDSSITEVLNEDILKMYLRIQMITAIAALASIYAVVYADEPLTPPSVAALLLRRAKNKALLVDIENLHSHAIHRLPRLDGTTLAVDESKPFLKTLHGTSCEKSIVTASCPTSESTEPGIPLRYMESITMALRNRSFLAFSIVFGLQVGVFYTIPAFLPQFVAGWSLKEIGWLGFIYQMAGVSGTLLIGNAMDIFQNHKMLMQLLLAGSLVSIASFIVSIGHLDSTLLSIAEVSWSRVRIYLSSSSIGFCLAALNTVGFEFGASVAYPCDEAALSGLMECLAELCGFILVSIGGQMSSNVAFICIMFGVLIASQLIILTTRIESRRPK